MADNPSRRTDNTGQSPAVVLTAMSLNDQNVRVPFPGQTQDNKTGIGNDLEGLSKPSSTGEEKDSRQDVGEDARGETPFTTPMETPSALGKLEELRNETDEVRGGLSVLDESGEKLTAPGEPEVASMLRPNAGDIPTQHKTRHEPPPRSSTEPMPHLFSSKADTDFVQPWPVKKSHTDRPNLWQRASRKASRPQAVHAWDKIPRIQRQATLTFSGGSDSDSDSSSSSSSDSEHDQPTLSRPTLPHRTDATSNTTSGRERELRASGKRQARRGPFSGFRIDHSVFQTKGRISKRDGRLKLHFSEAVNRGYFAKTLGASLKKHIKSGEHDSDADHTRSAVAWQDERGQKIAPDNDDMENPEERVRLNVVIIVIGSRGDVQPFLRIGKILKEDYGHRVRIATHPVFRDFVENDAGLEFFSVGGNPSELMAFMVKNPGLIPSMETIKEGEVGKRRAAMYDMFLGMWRACINATDDEEDDENRKMMGKRDPFVADAIIANPPSFAPPHIAERLGVPLHMMFTFPYSPTVHFPHPLANIRPGNVDPHYTNFMSYPLVEMMTWQGLGDLINRFRAKTLQLDEVSTLWAPGQLYRLKVPYTYMWSPGLVPKPKDWGPEIDVSGFVFLDLASNFKPPKDLEEFLERGKEEQGIRKELVYIGFGSIVVDDPDSFTRMIFDAVDMVGCRALVSKGWGGFGSNATAPENIFMLENTPHDWLFPRVSAVVHHGGAGTTAIGLKCAKPTMIIPFFGDQPFWGGMVSKKKAGAHECIPYKKLTAERLAEGIRQCLTDEARENVKKIADSIEAEGDGALNAVRSFHRSLPLKGRFNMRCELLPNRCAAWALKSTSLRLSPLAAELLVEWKKVRWNELRLLRIYEWNDFGGPGEPVTGLWGAVIGTADDVVKGVGLAPVKMAKSVRQREKYWKRELRKRRRQRHLQKTLDAANTAGQDADEAITDRRQPNAPNGTASGTSNAAPKRPDAERRTSSFSVTDPTTYLATELAQEAAHGLRKAGSALLKSPLTFSLAVAQGFHNAPRLYGDETVRPPRRITGFHSGVRAGRDEFIYGIKDGVTGLWRLPARGWREGGRGRRGKDRVVGELMVGLTGLGMGVGGLVLKNVAAVVGPWAFLLKGCHEQSRRKHQPTAYIRRARIIQGRKELAALRGRKASVVRGALEQGQAKRDGRKKSAGSVAKMAADDIVHYRDHWGIGTAGEVDGILPGEASALSKRMESCEQDEGQQIELLLSRHWEAIEPRVLAEKRAYRGGIRAALMGRDKGNQGKSLERKGFTPGMLGWGMRPSEEAEEREKSGEDKGAETETGIGRARSAPMNMEKQVAAEQGGVGNIKGVGEGPAKALVEATEGGDGDGMAHGVKRRVTAPGWALGYKDRRSKRRNVRSKLDGVGFAVRAEAKGR